MPVISAKRVQKMTEGNELGVCAAPTCSKKKARYYMTWWDNKMGMRVHGYVCGSHENYFARKNLTEQGFSKQEIDAIEKDMKATALACGEALLIR